MTELPPERMFKRMFKRMFELAGLLAVLKTTTCGAQHSKVRATDNPHDTESLYKLMRRLIVDR